MIHRKYKMIVGRNEPVIFADYDKEIQFPAKVDTGAYRSAVHCVDAQLVMRDGRRYLTGTLLAGHPCASGDGFAFETDSFDEVIVANSFGHEETRFEIKVRMKIGPLVFPTTTTLADRSAKLFPVLIGRKALRNRFLVDVADTNIDRQKLKKTLGADIPDDEEDFIKE